MYTRSKFSGGHIPVFSRSWHSGHARVPEVYINVYKRSYLTKLLNQQVWGKKLCVYSSAQNSKALNDKLTTQGVYKDLVSSYSKVLWLGKFLEDTIIHDIT